MQKWMTLTTLRRVTQLFFFVIMVYGAFLFETFYTGEKLTNALPALSCAYDKQSGDYCALIPLQHQIDHRVSGALTGNADIMRAVMPTLITLSTFVVLVILLNKAFCGWVCPLGFFQELLGRLGKKLGLHRTRVSESGLKKLRPIKWLMLGFLVFIFPLLTGLGFLGHEFGSPFCSVCPSRILTTLAVGDTSQLYLDSATPAYFALSLIADLLFGLMIALALSVQQPFCRICPMLALQAVFKRLGLLRLVKNGSSKCDKCGHCVDTCPMDIFELRHIAEGKNITHADCTLCGQCVEFCPSDDVLMLKYGPVTLFSSSKQYFKERVKIEKER